jgi:hypothetical protein
MRLLDLFWQHTDLAQADRILTLEQIEEILSDDYKGRPEMEPAADAHW